MASIKELCADLEDGKLAPVYFFTGDNVYRKTEIAAKIKELVNPDEFNDMREDGSSCKMAEVIAAASTAPVFSERRFILLNNVDKIRKNSNGIKVLAEYLEKPLDTTCLVIFHNDSKKSKKDKTLETACSDACVITDFADIKGRELEKWIKEHCAQKGIKILPEALQMMQEIVGSDLVALNTEIEKLSLYLLEKPDKTVTEEDFLSSVGLSKEGNPFALSNAILSLNREESLRLVQTLLDKGEEPVAVLNKISASALKLLRVKRLSEAGLSGAVLAQAAGLYNMERPLVYKTAAMPSSSALLKVIDKIIETDMAFKTSMISEPAISLKGVIMSLMPK